MKRSRTRSVPVSKSTGALRDVSIRVDKLEAGIKKRRRTVITKTEDNCSVADDLCTDERPQSGTSDDEGATGSITPSTCTVSAEEEDESYTLAASGVSFIASNSSENSDNDVDNTPAEFGQNSVSPNSDTCSPKTTHAFEWKMPELYDGVSTYDSDAADDPESLHSSRRPNSSYPFPNWTTGALAMIKHSGRISDHVMDSILEVCRHPNFKSSEVPTNSNALKETFQALPKLDACQLKIGQTHTGKDINFYYTDPLQLIGSILLSDKHIQKMMFMPIFDESNAEVFNSRLFRESPLFGLGKVGLTEDGSRLSPGSFATSTDLANIWRIEGAAWCPDSAQFTWMGRRLVSSLDTSGQAQAIIASEENPSGKTPFFVTDEVKPLSPETLALCTSEIELFRKSRYESAHQHSGTPIRREDYVTKDIPPLLHSNYHSVPPPQDVPVLRLFLQLYIDAFGALNKMYHSTAGVYITLENIPRKERLKTEHMYMLGLAEPGGNLQLAVSPLVTFVTDILQKGYFADCPFFGGKVFVTGGLGVLQADMPQANASTSCKGPGANLPCRCCTVKKGDLQKRPELLHVIFRNKESAVQQMNAMSHGRSSSAIAKMETESGVLFQPKNPLYRDDLHFDPFKTCMDPFHSEILGVAKLHMQCLWEIFNEKTCAWIERRRASFTLPYNCPKVFISVERRNCQ